MIDVPLFTNWSVFNLNCIFLISGAALLASHREEFENLVGIVMSHALAFRSFSGLAFEKRRFGAQQHQF